MSQAFQERMNAAELPPGSIVAVLLKQHVLIRHLFAKVASAHGEARRVAFDSLRTVLAVHEAGEEIVVRPVSKKAADGSIAEARNAEEKAAAETLAGLERFEDLDSPEFAVALAAFEKDVTAHAEQEEREEFPYLLTTLDDDRQLKMGARLLKVEETAPPHPHPAAAGSTVKQVLVGPFAAMLDEARDWVANSFEAPGGND